MNSIILSGNIVADGELKSTGIKGGIPSFILNFQIANNEKRGDKQEVCFVKIGIWNPSEAQQELIKKGKYITIQGKLKQDQWRDKDGNARQNHWIECSYFELPPRQKEQLKESEHEESES